MKNLILIFLLLCTELLPAQNRTVITRLDGKVDTVLGTNKILGQHFGDFKVYSGDNSLLSNKSLKGKIVFINFWFQHCAPCMAELDGLNELYKRLKNYRDFVFLSFTFESNAEIERLRKKHSVKYDVFHIDEAECYRLLLGNGFPTSFILDRKGVIKYYNGGGFYDKNKATKAVLEEIYPEILKLLK